MYNTSHIEISRSALQNNLEVINGILETQTSFFSVVKGNAYGHGIKSFVPLAFECGVKNFAVFSVDEAKEIVDTKINYERILLMGDASKSGITWLIQNNIEFYISDIFRLEQTIDIARTLDKKALIHIELETGMNRTGVDRSDLKSFLTRLKLKQDVIEFKAICSHLAGAESVSNHFRVKKQIQLFNQLSKTVSQVINYPIERHLACSAAVISYPKTYLDLCRVGILQYGFWPSKESKITFFNQKGIKIDPLKRVISWKSRVMSIKRVKEGEFVGYGTSYLAETDQLIALIPVGYAHGFSRSLSNQGKVLINGKRLGVIGTVNMNMLAVDISSTPETKINDEVVLIGEQGEYEITVSSFSDLSSQLNYEMLTRLPSSIPRIIVE